VEILSRHMGQKYACRKFSGWNNAYLSLLLVVFICINDGGQGQNRTADTGIFSRAASTSHNKLP
jgi:hypothetical protein